MVVIVDVLMTGVNIALFPSGKSSVGSKYFDAMLFFLGFLGGLRTMVSLSLSSSESL